jgi:hypothetical protein
MWEHNSATRVPFFVYICIRLARARGLCYILPP